MQRAPCSCSSACGSSRTNSWKSSTRTCLGRLSGSTRWIFRKPPSSPIPGEHLLLGLVVDLRLFAVVRSGTRLVGALGRHRGVLTLSRLADLATLLVPVADRVRGALAGAHGAGSRAVAVLRDHARLAGLDRGGLGLRALAQDALVVEGHDLHPPIEERVPLGENPLGDSRSGSLAVLLHEGTQLFEVLLGRRLELDHLGVALRREGAVGVEHVRDAAAHARREVAASRTEDDDAAAGHVLAAVVADTLDHRVHARVADAEALARQPAEERAAAGGAVEHGVADHDVLLRPERDALRRAHREHAARQALAGVVVGVAVEREGDPRLEPASEALDA